MAGFPDQVGYSYYKSGNVTDASGKRMTRVQNTGELNPNKFQNKNKSHKPGVLKQKDGKAQAFYENPTATILNNSLPQEYDLTFPGLINYAIPKFDIQDLMNDRNMFRKQLTTIAGEPAFYYFKIFFNFNTEYGLLGGVLNNRPGYGIVGDDGLPKYGTATARQYYEMIKWKYNNSQISSRIGALEKFVKLLNFIQNNEPWLFKEVQGLSAAGNLDMEKIGQPGEIGIKFREDTVDMKILTLLDLYKFCTYDVNDRKELLTDNLRKFDMSIMVYQVPVKYFQTGFFGAHGEQQYKYKTSRSDTAGGYHDQMSFKLFTFTGCEFKTLAIGQIINDTMSNDTASMLSNGGIKISYTRCYETLMNEWMKFGFNDYEFLYDWTDDSVIGMSEYESKNFDELKTRLSVISQEGDNRYARRQHGELQKWLTDYGEFATTYLMDRVPNLLNLYNQDVYKQTFGQNAVNTDIDITAYKKSTYNTGAIAGELGNGVTKWTHYRKGNDGGLFNNNHKLSQQQSNAANQDYQVIENSKNAVNMTNDIGEFYNSTYGSGAVVGAAGNGVINTTKKVAQEQHNKATGEFTVSTNSAVNYTPDIEGYNNSTYGSGAVAGAAGNGVANTSRRVALALQNKAASGFTMVASSAVNYTPDIEGYYESNNLGEKLF